MEESIKAETSFISFCKDSLKLGEIDVRTYSPLVLAYIGDAVYEVVIRTKVINHGSMQVNKMHKKSSSLVKAETQASLIKALEEELTEEEKAAYKRGRNAKSASTAKHATVIDYRMATGFEALIGYLYLTEQYERMITLISHGLEKIGE
ncbi:MAG: ribonuclease III [Clostridiaceae bacterium]|nr:ribonuclease III [Clostridiaceae bacterium]